jgi:ubiquinone/menaquinone biosynthesis C-methylase UbiE
MAMQYDIREIRALYERGENIIQWVRRQEGAENNTPTAIAYSYDMQAGSYVAELESAEILALKARLGRRLADVLDVLKPESLLDAGVGEATSLLPTLAAMKVRPAVLGFDFSVSRLLWAKRHLAAHGHGDATLFLADLDRVPLADASIDVVLTVHALEPNRGQERAILSELLRVARRHLVMVEPCYERATLEMRTWIDKHGYVRGLPETLQSLGHPARLIEPFGADQNPVNAASLFIVDIADAKPRRPAEFVSPISRRPLMRQADCWFCPDDGHAFPIVGGIPCLRQQNAVLASKLGLFNP